MLKEKTLIEKEKSSDLISEKVRYRMEIGSENIDSFPQVTDEDILAKKERYVALIGKWSVKGENVFMGVEGVIETDNLDSQGNRVAVDFTALQELLDEGKLKNQDLVNIDIIGEVHTHPEMGKNTHLPSSIDIEEWIRHYESGQFPSNKPFAFGISTRGDDGKNNLAFYRVIRDVHGKLFPKALNNWDWVNAKK